MFRLQKTELTIKLSEHVAKNWETHSWLKEKIKEFLNNDSMKVFPANTVKFYNLLSYHLAPSPYEMHPITGGMQVVMNNYYCVDIKLVKSSKYDGKAAENHTIYVQLHGGESEAKFDQLENGKYDIYLGNNEYNVMIIGDILRTIDESLGGKRREEKNGPRMVTKEMKIKMSEMLTTMSGSHYEEQMLIKDMNLLKVRTLKKILGGGNGRAIDYDAIRRTNELQDMVKEMRVCASCKENRW